MWNCSNNYGCGVFALHPFKFIIMEISLTNKFKLAYPNIVSITIFKYYMKLYDKEGNVETIYFRK